MFTVPESGWGYSVWSELLLTKAAGLQTLSTAVNWNRLQGVNITTNQCSLTAEQVSDFTHRCSILLVN